MFTKDRVTVEDLGVAYGAAVAQRAQYRRVGLLRRLALRALAPGYVRSANRTNQAVAYGAPRVAPQRQPGPIERWGARH